MKWYFVLLLAVLVLIAVLITVVLIRTAMFKPKKTEKKNYEEINFDKDKAVDSLRQLIRCKTVSDKDPEKENLAEFDKLYELLPVLYPNVFKTCSLTKLPGKALLFKWTGKKHENPAVLMAHYDVVSVVEENWQKPPFEGIIEDGVLWGRGALDTKVTFNGVLFSSDTLIGEGFVPENDIYFAFSGGEEINGTGAVNIVNYFKENNIKPYMVVDEGGAVVDNVFPGVKSPCGLIGIAEKGLMNLQYTVKSAGGHASAPLPHTPVGVLSKACCKVENHPFKMHITKPVAEMFDTLGRKSTFAVKMIFANLWLFKGTLDRMCRKSGGELNALVRTTVAFTQMEGSKGSNVIPPVSTMVSNIRINPADTVDGVIAYINKTVGDENVVLYDIESKNPSPVSYTDNEAYKRVADSVEGTWQGSIVSPYLMVQCSDSRHYGEISRSVYRFSAMDLTSDERKTIHGNNERIRLTTAIKAVEFYIRLIKQC